MTFISDKGGHEKVKCIGSEPGKFCAGEIVVQILIFFLEPLYFNVLKTNYIKCIHL